MFAFRSLGEIWTNRLPDLFRNERHERMEQPQELIERSHEDVARRRLALATSAEGFLGQLDIPVTELVPDELIERQRGDIELIGVYRAGHTRDGLVEAAQDPSFGETETIDIDRRKWCGG